MRLQVLLAQDHILELPSPLEAEQVILIRLQMLLYIMPHQLPQQTRRDLLDLTQE